MSIEEAIMGGIVFKGKKDKPKEEEKVKTKAKKATYIRGQHGSGAAKMKADIRKKRASSVLQSSLVFQDMQSGFLPASPGLYSGNGRCLQIGV